MMAPATSLALLTSTGPASWPSAKAAVMPDIKRAGTPRERRRASCRPAIVTTMKVPPTHTALTTMAHGPMARLGAMTPAAITHKDPAATRRGDARGKSLPTATVDSAAAAPNSGQAQPKTAGSATTLRAMTGKNVAGMM